MTQSSLFASEQLSPSWQAQRADAIIIGTISRNMGSKSVKWNPTGKRQEEIVYTDFEVVVDRVLGKKVSLEQDVSPGAKVTVRILGGRTATTESRYEAAPDAKIMATGNRLLMFLTLEDPFTAQEGGQHLMLYRTGAFALKDGFAERPGLDSSPHRLDDLYRVVNDTLRSRY